MENGQIMYGEPVFMPHGGQFQESQNFEGMNPQDFIPQPHHTSAESDPYAYVNHQI
jgi:hypothetical protein